MKDTEDNINHQVDQIIEIETDLETILETVLEINKMVTEEQQEDPIGLEINLKTMQVIDQILGQEMVKMILNRNPTNIVNVVIMMVILRNNAGRYKPI